MALFFEAEFIFEYWGCCAINKSFWNRNTVVTMYDQRKGLIAIL